jgi:hypothetical protein
VEDGGGDLLDALLGGGLLVRASAAVVLEEDLVGEFLPLPVVPGLDLVAGHGHRMTPRTAKKARVEMTVRMMAMFLGTVSRGGI